MKNYKIETLGLNEAILHKAVEEGYDDYTEKQYLFDKEYLILNETGLIGWHDVGDVVRHNRYTEISAHDFLRLNWTPKVGEEVECVDSDSFANEYIQKSKKYKVIAIWKDVRGIKVKGPDIWFDLQRFIPIYPRKKEQPKEKPDAYIECGDNSNVYINTPTEKRKLVSVYDLHKYNIMDVYPFKAKYPNKLMFKNWEVEINGQSAKIGCVKTLTAQLRVFYKDVRDSPAEEMELRSVTLWDLYKFIHDNKEKLGL